ncbi:ATP synthase A chain [Mycoplasmopsis meleagridis]|uniref:ATP synthase A chain n=1 Tax=Mycoplasmopsis meleagridis ATCC 25294 TaxID=1264554 RepID=A0A0F5H0H8_9BACT|nr:F0F1 ATP synthase subunit A [Mycoplasmopsis meleagridis]KKB26630.1 ATP synthase A chain [Mycoplasmopsis meleagridis ATCC 25294]OAD18255.1 ATP synthase A chain [Mycoplasmopsis meleagridis]VEU77684.1 F0F1 ATP synthase subunit A [Mycoplasmopsis meleagridis]
MDKIVKHINDWNHPQLFSLFITVLICLILSLAVFIEIKRTSRPNKAPSAFLIIMEGYVTTVDNMFYEATDGKISKAKIYIFGLASFLLIGNLLAPLGIEPIVTSYSVPFTLALITWLGIFVVGLTYQKFRFFLRYVKNPVEIIGQFAPLISLSFRIFGNIIGGGTIIFLTYWMFGFIWRLIPGQETNNWFFFGVIVTPFMHVYFDIFSAFIQALVFSTLTVIYWSREAEEESKPKENKLKKVKTITTQQSIY